MKCEIRVPEPSILRDAKPGDLFMLCDAYKRECVFARLEPSAPGRSFFTGEVSLLKLVVIACRVDVGEPGYYSPGTLVMVPPTDAIQFVEQTVEAEFRSRTRNCDLKVRVNVVFGGGGVGTSHSLRDAGEFLKPGDQL